MSEIWYPSLVVNFRLRFDESFQVAAEIPEPGPSGGDPNSVEITAATSRLPFEGVAKNFATYTSGTRPLITRTGKDNLSVVVERVPKSASVELPGYRQAGKFSLEFDWRELPIDPRLIRSAAVEIFAGTVSAQDFATGMTSVEPGGRRRSVLNTTDDGGLARDDLMLIAGIVDTWYVEHNEESSVVKLEGRDLRGVFLDSPMDPEVLSKIDLSRPVTDVISDVLKGHPAAGYMKIKYSPGDWPGGKPPAVLDKEGLTRVRKKANGEGASAGSQSDTISAWDIITRYCFLVGAVPFFRGRDIVVRPATSIFDQSKPKFSSADKVFDPATRLDDQGDPFTTRKMVFGRNIKSLSFERKLSGTKVPVVEIVSFDTSSTERGAKKLLIEQWPPKDEKMARIAGVSPSGEVSQEDKVKISVPGIRDRNKLLGIARSVWEEVGRGELGGACRTTQMGSFKGSNSDPDLLRLRPGDVVEFLVDTRQLGSRAPNASTFIDSNRRSFDEQVNEVKMSLSGKANSGDENLARVLVASARSAIIDLLRSFRVANVVYAWSISNGMNIAFDFQNYFVVRHGINEQLGKNVVPPIEKVIDSTTVKRPKQKVLATPVVAPKTPAPGNEIINRRLQRRDR